MTTPASACACPYGPAMDEVAEVVRGGGQGGIVGEELTVEGRESVRRGRPAVAWRRPATPSRLDPTAGVK